MKRCSILFVTLMLLFFCTSIFAQVNEKVFKKLATDMVVALNSNDVEIRKNFLETHYINADSLSAIERWQGHLERFAHMLGKSIYHSVDVSNPNDIRILVKTTNPRAINQWTELSLVMDSDKKDKYRTLGLYPAQDPSINLPDRVLTNDEIIQYLQMFIDAMVTRDVFSGTVSIVKDGKPIFQQAYGKAELRWGIANRIDTKFNLGSMNKMFTGVAICQLASQKKLSFDDPIIKYLPELKEKKIAKNVTIHHLLTHTSGMGSYWDAMSDMDWTILYSVKDFADLTINDSLLFEPGERFHYSNSGPVYLGLIIESITGMDYHDYIREYVTGPAGMPNTDCFYNADIVPNLAQGYWWNDEAAKLQSNIFEHSARGSAAGGGFSTVLDLQNFAKSLLDGTLLSSEMFKIFSTGKVEMDPDAKYGYLINERIWNGHIISIGHGGGAPGINSDLKIFKDLGYTIAVMGNYDQAASAISNYAAELIIHRR